MTAFFNNDAATTQYDFITNGASDMPFPEQGEVSQLGLTIMTEILDTFGKDATEEHASMIAHCIIGGIQTALNRIEGQYDRAAYEMDQLRKEQDGSEVKDGQLQDATRKARYFEAMATVLETFRDGASETFTTYTGDIWTPYKGAAKSSTTTFAILEASETVRRKQKRDNIGAEAGAQYVLFRGVQGADTKADQEAIFKALDHAYSRFPEMQLGVTGNEGAETIAIMWANCKKVKVQREKMNKKVDGNAAPFRCNDRLLKLEPVMVLGMTTRVNPTNEKEAEESGIVLNMMQKASDLKTKPIVYRVTGTSLKRFVKA